MTVVAVDCFGIRSPVKGVARIGRNFVRELAKAPCDYEFVLLGLEDPAWENLPLLPNTTRVLASKTFSRSFWFAVHLPRVLRDIRPDLVHGLNDLLPARLPCPAVLTVTEDPVRRSKGVTGRRRLMAAEHRLSFRSSLRRSSAIVAISSTVADDLERGYGYSRDRITVAHPGVDRALSDASPVSPGFGPYFLTFGTRDERERLPLVLEAFRQFRLTGHPAHLAVVGATLEPVPSADGVRFLGRVSDVHLAGLYASAAALIDVSEFEGFGFQILEACYYGTPIIASRIPTVLEIAGESAVTAPDPSPSWLASAMRSVFSDPGKFRPVLQTPAAWDPFMAATYDTYAAALGRPRR